MTPRDLFDETFRRCMPQATVPFYTEITNIEDRRDRVVADVILFDGGCATFEVMKPDIVGCYGFSCPKKNDGAAFEWKGGRWQRCDPPKTLSKKKGRHGSSRGQAPTSAFIEDSPIAEL